MLLQVASFTGEKRVVEKCNKSQKSAYKSGVREGLRGRRLGVEDLALPRRRLAGTRARGAGDEGGGGGMSCRGERAVAHESREKEPAARRAARER